MGGGGVRGGAKGHMCWSKIIALIRDTPGDIAFFVHDILRYYHLTELRYFG